jgi:hypothetical protein
MKAQPDKMEECPHNKTRFSSGSEFRITEA